MRDRFSYARYLEVQQRQQVFSDVALSVGNVFTLTGRGDLEQLTGLHASAALLPALGLEPVLGRNFSADEDRRRGERVALKCPASFRGAVPAATRGSGGATLPMQISAPSPMATSASWWR